MSVSTERWELLRHQLICRTGGRCDHCWLPLDDRWNAHHRRLKRTGPNTLSNLLALRSGCHVLIHSERTTAEILGLIVPQTTDWQITPVVRQSGQMILLDDFGGWEPYGWMPARPSLAA